MTRPQIVVRGLILLALLFPCLVLGLLRLLYMLASGDEASARRALRALDMAANANALAGSPFETMSSHCGRVQTTWWARGVIWITDRVDRPGHCVGAAAHERPLLQLIEKFTNGGESA